MKHDENGNGSADIFKRPGVTPKELHEARLLPLSLNGIYAACKSGDIQSFTVGMKIIIPTKPLARKLGIEAALD